MEFSIEDAFPACFTFFLFSLFSPKTKKFGADSDGLLLFFFLREIKGLKRAFVCCARFLISVIHFVVVRLDFVSPRKKRKGSFVNKTFSPTFFDFFVLVTPKRNGRYRERHPFSAMVAYFIIRISSNIKHHAALLD